MAKSDDLQPAAMHEMAAAKYLGMCKTALRKLVFSGQIPFAEHTYGKTRIYLRAHLDDYLRGLNWRKDKPDEVSEVVSKGDGY
jgi:hypothetical protein